MPETKGRTSRPEVWHENCKPPIGDPARRVRICPGCGRRHTIPPATSSSYCDDACKAIYVAYTNNPLKKKDRICFCRQPMAKTRTARQFRLCERHDYYYGMLALFADESNNKKFTHEEMILLITNDLQDLDDFYYTPIQRSEAAMPTDQRKWATLLPDRNPRTTTQPTASHQDTHYEWEEDGDDDFNAP